MVIAWRLRVHGVHLDIAAPLGRRTRPRCRRLPCQRPLSFLISGFPSRRKAILSSVRIGRRAGGALLLGCARRFREGGASRTPASRPGQRGGLRDAHPTTACRMALTSQSCSRRVVLPMHSACSRQLPPCDMCPAALRLHGDSVTGPLQHILVARRLVCGCLPSRVRSTGCLAGAGHGEKVLPKPSLEALCATDLVGSGVAKPSHCGEVAPRRMDRTKVCLVGIMLRP